MAAGPGVDRGRTIPTASVLDVAPTIGELEEEVLLTMLHVGDETYSVPVACAIREKTGRDVSPGTVYMVLKRLEERGFVESRVGTPDPEKGGRPRRFFQIDRDAALPALRRSRRSLLALRAGLEPELEARWNGVPPSGPALRLQRRLPDREGAAALGWRSARAAPGTIDRITSAPEVAWPTTRERPSGASGSVQRSAMAPERRSGRERVCSTPDRRAARTTKPATPASA